MPLLMLVLRDGWLRVVYVVAFAAGALQRFFRPAENALLPRLVGVDRLMTANALNSLNDNLARIAGSAAGGLLLATTGLAGAVIVDAASFLVAAGLIALIVVPAVPDAATAADAVVQGAAPGWVRVWHEWLDDMRLIWRDRLLRFLLLVVTAGAIADSLLTALLVPFIVDNVAGGAAAFGIVLAGRGVAGVLGGLVIGRFGQQAAPTTLLGWSLIGVDAGLLLMINIPAIALVLLVQLTLGPAIIPWLTGQQTLLQTATADRYRGRVFGAEGTIWSLMALAGIAIGSALGDVVGIVPLLNHSAVLFAGAGALALVLLRQALRPSALEG